MFKAFSVIAILLLVSVYADADYTCCVDDRCLLSSSNSLDNLSLDYLCLYSEGSCAPVCHKLPNVEEDHLEDLGCMTRKTVLARGKRWVDLGVSYSQTSTFEGYRKDCSGFVSMACLFISIYQIHFRERR
ncbi:hypothetical protein RCL1_007926 [Eukaryota sp. TZLM3-RCL]